MLKPLHPILFVSEKACFEIPRKSITPEIVGEKAFGLSCLPKAWTLPFIVVSGDLLSLYANASSQKRKILLKSWEKQIISSILSIGINKNDLIIVRSSGCLEGVEERGRFHSTQGTTKDIIRALLDCFEKIISDKDWHKQKIPIVIQKCVGRFSAKGHLSNERQWYKEDRDWLGQFEEGIKTGNEFFKINIRNWRKEIIVDTDKPLECDLIANVSRILRIPAAWGYNKHSRIHFEWVWDGGVIYIVQADQEVDRKGEDPTKIYQSRYTTSTGFRPTCLKIVNETHAARYNKIHNVFIYKRLKLPVTRLYVLDDQAVIKRLTMGKISPDLKKDLLLLAKNPLVIRMDIVTNDKNKYQMLPRVEVQDVKKAVAWLIKSSAQIKKKVREDIAFIFHNFVPAVSSAFAYATPEERKVQIEALWGLPEGLYYYAQDKYVVDTQKQYAKDLRKEDVPNFEVQERPYYKHYFVSPDKNCQWTTKTLKPNYDWKPSIQKLDWVKEIAFESRRIAMEEKKSLSIMWFINVPRSVCTKPIFPWYHESFDPQKTSRPLIDRAKNPYEKTIIIKSAEDLKKLKNEARKKHSDVRRIRIQPQEDSLLRNKYMLRDIGELAKKIEATILLDGGELSHAYYQLMQTKAIVQVQHPFGDDDHKQDFNKLVRDKIPYNVEQGGEKVSKARLSGEYLLRALREKLVEESFEVLDATHRDSIIGELADVAEVINGILHHLGITIDELKRRQEQKKQKAGGFGKGLVLVDTQNPLPSKKKPEYEQSLFDGTIYSNKKDEFISIDERAIMELGHKIKSWSDQRSHPGATEEILDMLIPIVKDNWSVDTPKIIMEVGDMFRVRIIGERMGSKFKIKLSVFIPQKQKDLL